MPERVWREREPSYTAGENIGRCSHQENSRLAQSCLTLCDPMDGSLPGSSVHGDFQSGILERVAVSSSNGE